MGLDLCRVPRGPAAAQRLKDPATCLGRRPSLDSVGLRPGVPDTTWTAAKDPAERVRQPAGGRVSAATDDAGRRRHEYARDPAQNSTTPEPCRSRLASHRRVTSMRGTSPGEQGIYPRPSTDHGVLGRSGRSPSISRSTRSLKKAIRFSIFGHSGIGDLYDQARSLWIVPPARTDQ